MEDVNEGEAEDTVAAGRGRAKRGRPKRKVGQTVGKAKDGVATGSKKGKRKLEEMEKVLPDNEEQQVDVCGICLADEIEVRGKLECCEHIFCFTCIMKWADVETRCPLCKRRFRRVEKIAKNTVKARGTIIRVRQKDQKYNPTEEELREVVDPYGSVLCTECHNGVDDELLLLCDRCDAAAHTYCIGLGHSVPEGEYICGLCRSVDERLQQAAPIAGEAEGVEAAVVEAVAGWETGEEEWESSEYDSLEVDDASEESGSEGEDDSEDDNEASEYEEVVAVTRIRRGRRRTAQVRQTTRISRSRRGRRRTNGSSTTARRPRRRTARTVARRAASRTGTRASTRRTTASQRVSASTMLGRIRRNANSRLQQTRALVAHFVNLSRPALAARSAVPVAARRPATLRQTPGNSSAPTGLSRVDALPVSDVSMPGSPSRASSSAVGFVHQASRVCLNTAAEQVSAHGVRANLPTQMQRAGGSQHDVVNLYREQWEAIRNGIVAFPSPSPRRAVGSAAPQQRVPSSSERRLLSVSTSVSTALPSSSEACSMPSANQSSRSFRSNGTEATGNVQRQVATMRPTVQRAWVTAERARSLLLSVRGESQGTGVVHQSAAAGSGGGRIGLAASRAQQTLRAHINSSGANGAAALRVPRDENLSSRLQGSAVVTAVRAGASLACAEQNEDGHRQVNILSTRRVTSSAVNRAAATHTQGGSRLSTAAQAELSLASVDQNRHGCHHENATKAQPIMPSANVAVRPQGCGSNCMSTGAQAAVSVTSPNQSRNGGRYLEGSSCANTLAVNGAAGAHAHNSDASVEAKAGVSAACAGQKRVDERQLCSLGDARRGEDGLVARRGGFESVEKAQGNARTNDPTAEGADAVLKDRTGGSCGGMSEHGLSCPVLQSGESLRAETNDMSGNVVVCRPPRPVEGDQRAEAVGLSSSQSLQHDGRHTIPTAVVMRRSPEEPVNSRSAGCATLVDKEATKRSSRGPTCEESPHQFVAAAQKMVNESGGCGSSCISTGLAGCGGQGGGDGGHEGGDGEGGGYGGQEELAMATGLGKVAGKRRGAKGDADVNDRPAPRFDGRTCPASHPEVGCTKEKDPTHVFRCVGEKHLCNRVNREEPLVVLSQLQPCDGHEGVSGICETSVVTFDKLRRYSRQNETGKPDNLTGFYSRRHEPGKHDSLRGLVNHEARERRPTSDDTLSCMTSELRGVSLGSDQGGRVDEGRRWETCVTKGGGEMGMAVRSTWASGSIKTHGNNEIDRTNQTSVFGNGWANVANVGSMIDHSQPGIHGSVDYEGRWVPSAPLPDVGGWVPGTGWPDPQWRWQQPSVHANPYGGHGKCVSLLPMPVQNQLLQWRDNRAASLLESRGNQAASLLVEKGLTEWRGNQAAGCGSWEEQGASMSGGGDNSLVGRNGPKALGHQNLAPPWEAGGVWETQKSGVACSQRYHHLQSSGIETYSEHGWGFGSNRISQADGSLTSGRTLVTGSMACGDESHGMHGHLLMGGQGGRREPEAPPTWAPVVAGNGPSDFEGMTKGMMPSGALPHTPIVSQTGETLAQLADGEHINRPSLDCPAVSGGSSFQSVDKIYSGYTVGAVGPAQALDASGASAGQKLTHGESDQNRRNCQVTTTETFRGKKDAGEEGCQTKHERDREKERRMKEKEERKLQKERAKEWLSRKPIAADVAAKLVKKELRPLYDEKRIDKEKFKAAARAATHSLLEEWGYSSKEYIGEAVHSMCCHDVLLPARLGRGVQIECLEKVIEENVCRNCVENHVYRALIDDLMKAKG